MPSDTNKNFLEYSEIADVIDSAPYCLISFNEQLYLASKEERLLSILEAQAVIEPLLALFSKTSMPIGVLKKANKETHNLVSSLTSMPRDTYFTYQHTSMRTQSYEGTELREVTISSPPRCSVVDEHIIVIDDVFDSGLTYAKVVEYLSLNQAASVELMVLINEDIFHTSRVHAPLYECLTTSSLIPSIDDGKVSEPFLVGGGMDYLSKRFRELPGIYGVDVKTLPPADRLNIILQREKVLREALDSYVKMAKMNRRQKSTPFESVLSVRPDLYKDESEAHAATHEQVTTTKEEQQQEVARVLNVGRDPVSGKELPADEVPKNVLKSRRGNSVYVESFVFKPTAPQLLAQMDQFLETFSHLIKAYKINTEHHIVQIKDALHFAFGSVTPPNTREKFFSQKRIASDETSASYKGAAWKKLIHYCQKFLDQVEPSMMFKEIKMNPDGHVVLRMTIQQSQSYLDFKNTWQRLFSDNYQRYTDPEKVTTLASVLGVVDLFAIPEDQRVAFTAELNEVFTQITASMKNKSYPCNHIEFTEASNRMLQTKDMLGRLTIQRGYVRLSNRSVKDHSIADPVHWPHILQKYCQATGFFKLEKKDAEDRSASVITLGNKR